jgi:hypothetical protein
MKRNGVLCFLLSSLLALLLSPLPVSAIEDGWISLFDGKSLKGWKASERAKSFKVVDGQIVTDGPRSHLFFVGPTPNPEYVNFELSVDVMTQPGANSGVYFHTQYQEKDWPSQGFEIQINNTHIGTGDYREFKKTGSLYGVRNVYKQLVPDNEWFNLRTKVVGKRVQIWLNQLLVVDYQEPASPRDAGLEPPNQTLGHGTFALQCHDEGSKVFFKNIRVRPLPMMLESQQPQPPRVDAVWREILRLSHDNYPLVDFHVHLKGGLTLEDALARSRQLGIGYGIAPNCGMGFPITSDAGIADFLKSMKGQPVFLGMQAEGREWVTLFSKDAVAQFDYVFSDAMTFRDDSGKRTRLWIPEEVEIKDKQAFMEMYVERILGVMKNEPIDIYVNPTFLPEVISGEYDLLWTPERMRKVIDAARQNDVAIEINSRYRLPSPAFIRMAKQAGVKFSLGTNNASQELGRSEYGLEMIKECGLTTGDMFMPKPAGQKKIQKGSYPQFQK